MKLRVATWYGGAERRLALAVEIGPRFVLFAHLGRRIIRVWYGDALSLEAVVDLVVTTSKRAF